MITRQDVEKYLKTDYEVSKIKTGIAKNFTLKDQARKVSEELMSIKSVALKEAYLKNEVGLSATERRKVMKLFQPDPDIEALAQEILSYKNKKGRTKYLKEQGLNFEQRKKVLIAARVLQMTKTTIQRGNIESDDVSTAFANTAGGARVAALAKETEEVGPSFGRGDVMKFRNDENKNKTRGFASGAIKRNKSASTSRGKRPVGF